MFTLRKSPHKPLLWIFKAKEKVADQRTHYTENWGQTSKEGIEIQKSWESPEQSMLVGTYVPQRTTGMSK